MLETPNLVRKYTHISSFRKYTFQYRGPFNFPNVCIFFKKSLFGKNSTLTQSNSVRNVLEIFQFSFQFFFKLKCYYSMVTINENISFEDSASRIRLPDCSIFAINQKNDNDVTIFRHDVIVKFFKLCFIYLVKFSYWSKFNVSIITGSRIIIIFFYKEFTRNLEIGNTPV